MGRAILIWFGWFGLDMVVCNTVVFPTHVRVFVFSGNVGYLDTHHRGNEGRPCVLQHVPAQSERGERGGVVHDCVKDSFEPLGRA